MAKRDIDQKPSTYRGKRRNILKSMMGMRGYKDWLRSGHPESDEIKDIIERHKTK